MNYSPRHILSAIALLLGVFSLVWPSFAGQQSSCWLYLTFFRNLHRLLLIPAVMLFASCATHSVVTPMADVRPVRESNARVREDIKSTKTKIQESREHNEKGAPLLQDAINDLDRLLNE